MAGYGLPTTTGHSTASGVLTAVVRATARDGWSGGDIRPTSDGVDPHCSTPITDSQLGCVPWQDDCRRLQQSVLQVYQAV